MTGMSKAGAAIAGPAHPALVMTLLMMLTFVPNARAQPRLPDDTAGQTAGQTARQTVVPERQTGPEDSFRLRVRDEMAEWRRKMRTFDEAVETSTRRHANAAEARLRTAWDDTEVEARNVQAATASDWDRTKRAYEAASHRMALAWDTARL
jgi:hypothetical protein